MPAPNKPFNKRLLPTYMFEGGRIPNFVFPVYYLDKDYSSHHRFQSLSQNIRGVQTIEWQPRTINQHIYFDVKHAVSNANRKGHGRNSKGNGFRGMKGIPQLTLEEQSNHNNNNNTMNNNNENSKMTMMFGIRKLQKTVQLFNANAWRFGGSAFASESIPSSMDMQMNRDYGEVCLAGESNAGKSSLVNRVMNYGYLNEGLAVVSKQPGRTRMINFYNLRSSLCMADLMGYGYAEGLNSNVTGYWARFMRNYMIQRHSKGQLKMVYLLIDAGKIYRNICKDYSERQKKKKNNHNKNAHYDCNDDDSDSEDDQQDIIDDVLHSLDHNDDSDDGRESSSNDETNDIIIDGHNQDDELNGHENEECSETPKSAGSWSSWFTGLFQSKETTKNRNILENSNDDSIDYDSSLEEIPLEELCELDLNPWSQKDKEMMKFLNESRIPFTIVLTKIDTMNDSESLFKVILSSVSRTIYPQLMADPHILVTSARLGFGILELQCSMAYHCKALEKELDLGIDMNRLIDKVMDEVDFEDKQKRDNHHRYSHYHKKGNHNKQNYHSNKHGSSKQRKRL